MHFPARLLPLFLAALTLPVSQLVFPGCATMIDGPRQSIRVQSQPVGAQVFLNGKPIGKTPTTAIASRWGRHRLRLEMPGYQPLDIPLEKKFNDNAGNNILIGGVWIVVDAVTGAIFRLDVPPKTRADLLLRLGEEDGVFGMQVLTISTALKPDPSTRRIGQMERR